MPSRRDLAIEHRADQLRAYDSHTPRATRAAAHRAATKRESGRRLLGLTTTTPMGGR